MLMLGRALKENQNGYGKPQYKVLDVLPMRNAIVFLQDSLTEAVLTSERAR